MGDYGAWQVALWQNADVVLFFLKTREFGIRKA